MQVKTGDFIRSAIAAIVAWTLCFSPGSAQSYPHGMVTLVTHSRAGGGSDVFLRRLSEFLGPHFGTEFIVENVRGGSGAKAMARMANAPPDGSVFYATTPTFINTSLLSTLEYTYKDLTGVVNVFLDPQVIYVPVHSPHNTLTDVLNAARTTPGSVRIGVGSPGSLERQAMEGLKTQTGITAPVITHDGGGELLINVLNGTVTFGVGEIQELSAQLDAGRIRLITVLTEDRVGDFPDVMTAREQDVDLVVNKFRGIAGPRGLPVDILNAWESGVEALLKDDAFRNWYRARGLVPLFLKHDDYGIFLDEFAGQQRAYFRAFGVLPE